MPIRQLFKRSSVPLYVQIADLMRQRINRGQWSPGEQLPTLEALVEEFEVARLTIKQAMDVLSNEGLIVRERGRGTFASDAPRGDRSLHLETSLDRFWSMYVGTTPRLVREDRTAPSLGPGDGKPAEAYYRMLRVNSREGVAFGIADVYVDAALFARCPDRFRTETVVAILLESPDIRIARAHQTLTVGSADVHAAELLEIPINSATAHVRRVFNDAADVAIYVAEITYRGDFVRIEMDLTK